MHRTIKIGSKDVGLTANAATPHFFKDLFHIDLLTEMTKDNAISLVDEMAFIMAKQSETHDDYDKMESLTKKDFINWLKEFEATDVTTAGDEVLSLYMAQAKTTSVPKNEAE